MSGGIETISFFDSLAGEMNAHPERFAPLGEAEMVVEVVMSREGGAFRARLTFEELGCSGVSGVEGAPEADFRLEGPIEAWQAMFDDIAAHGHATGKYTINSLALMGDEIACLGDDPMGLDKFSRFNQTLQEFLDGAARAAAGAR